LGYEHLKQRCPGIIMASITGFGQDGPRKDFKTSDIISFAMGGVMYISGDPSYPPCNAPESIAYYTASIHAALAVLFASYHRKIKAEGQYIDISIQECQAIQEHSIIRYSAENFIIKRYGSQHQLGAPANIFPCKDGYCHLFIFTAGHWKEFLQFWEDHPDEFNRPEWDSYEFRRKNAEKLNHFVSEFTKNFNKDELSEKLQARGISCVPINNPADFFASPHVKERGCFMEIEHPKIGKFFFPVPPYRFSEASWEHRLPAPSIGEHNEEIYCGELGYSKDELSTLRYLGIV